MVKTNFDTAVFYTCGTCNLQCKYCNIDKNPILVEIDKALEKSFEGDYYFERVKKYFPNRGKLKRIETWGGEPFLRMDRIYPTLHNLISYYPYLDEMFSSTNFSYDSWIEQFFGLMDQFKLYPERDFKYFLQLSMDGPEYINDENRGVGVTKRCLQNYNLMLEELKKGRLAENVELIISPKPTLDLKSLHQLNDKDKIIEYFQFFEDNLIKPCMDLNLKNVTIHYTCPNTAVPAPVTVEDGKMFAEICKKIQEIEVENVYKHYFQYYEKITIYSPYVANNNLTYKYSHHTCGSGTTLIGFLPDNMISVCHEGFTHFIAEYKKLAATSKREGATINFDKFLNEQSVPYCLDDEGFAEHCRKMLMFNNPDTTARLINITSQIFALALAGQIEKCYLDQTNALKAAIFIQNRYSFCIKDNYNTTGSFTLIPNGILKLLLNGAFKYIRDEDELDIEECKGGACSGCNYCQ